MGKVFIQYRSNKFLTIVSSNDNEVTPEMAANMILQSDPFYPTFKKLKYCEKQQEYQKNVGCPKVVSCKGKIYNKTVLINKAILAGV